MAVHESVPQSDFPPSARTRIRRQPRLGSYSRADVYPVLDASPLCHVGYRVDGAPFVTPTLQWRRDNTLYWHGSIASRFLQQADGSPVCLTCTLLEGYVLARSAFNHTVNYRSVMVFGTARVLKSPEDKESALRALTNGLFAGRWETLRPMDEAELNATTVLHMDIEEATVKCRTGPPDDTDEADFPVWSGVIPVVTQLGTPQPAPEQSTAVPLPRALAELVRSGGLRKA
jgi:nitroimidazol reductase NimA-like FMN-containing flavoprotein (pyridoxamine 5'-phosphate oxidase superfamily)